MSYRHVIHPTVTRREFMRCAGAGWLLATGVVATARAEAQRLPESRAMQCGNDGLVALARGRFRGSDLMHRATGLATLYRCGDSSCLVRLTAFRVTNGPDLHVVLARHPDPANAGDIRRGYVVLGPLRATEGDQEYTVPAPIDATAFASVAVYCRIFGVLFAPAPLHYSGDLSG